VAVSSPLTPRGLIDTGAILAVLDRDDRWHRRCVDALASLRLPLATSGAVLTELFHLLGDDSRTIAAAWAFLRSGAVTVLGIDDGDLPELEALMKRYADRPMDFADATLVHLARRERLNVVFTIDHDDFETYRIDGRRRFRIMPTMM
jgi:predicted nucleic acid-binding protein